ncbi:uncharacterized protein LOC106162821 [Lingula anatina]|uniref:Uncharacterized protein LOC106162821 n=1 Tax=Lingula anatina TaxID=7574 RepID=A0A2R2MP21_LINAN|nr:uncharacterized protein LOC106162821 [Lingula anatina]|eukprot:XP_023931976.1 uncharacterized protein LOC106162821 [Lingula anatina]
MANANAEGDASFLAQLLAVRQSGGGAGVGGVFERINGLEEAVTILQSDMVDAKKQLLEMTLSLENIKRDKDNPKLDLEMQELRQRVHGLETQLDTWGHFEDESIRSIPDQLEGLGDCDINDGDRIASTEDIYTAEMGSEAKKDDTEVTGANKGEPDTEEKFSAILKRPMTEKSKKVLVDCIGLLGNHPDLNSVIGVLFENSILSASELMRLESVQTTAEQSKILLTKILPAKAEGAFWGFRKALASLPHTEFLIGILDDKLRCIFLELTAEVKRAFGRSVRNAPAASQEIHQQLQKLTPELVQVMEHLGLIVSRIRPGSIKIDLVFWNIEQLDKFWTWLHSRQRSPLSDALSRVILTDEVRGLVPDDELVVMLSSSLDWNGYMAARKRLLADTLSKVARDDLYFECQKLHTEVKISPYLTVFGDVTRYSDVSPKDLVRLACANGYPDLIPRLQSNFPLELSDFTAKDVRLERARELARIREKMHRVKVSKLIDRIGKKDAEISSLEGELKEVRLKCISLEVALEDQSDRGLRTVLENKNAEIARIKKMYDEEKKKATKLESDLDLANKEKAGLMKQLHSKSIGFQTDRANQPNVLVGKAPLQDEEQILVNFNEEALQDVGRSREGLGRKQSREQLTNIAKGEVTSEYPHASSNIDDPREDSKSPQAEASLSQNEQPLTAQAEKTTAPLTATQNRGRNVVRPDGRSNGLDTVLLLDTSGSMAGEAFDQMIQAVKSILDNMEYSADIYGFTENVSLITVGGYRQSRVLVSLSCDYQRARRILETLKSEGMSPLAPAIQEAQREIQRNGASLHVSGRKVAPRIYVFTDGIPSDEDEYRTSDLTEGNMAMTMLMAEREF